METGQSPDTIVISDEELKSLTDAILQRHGIDFSVYEPKSLKRRVLRTLHVFKLNTIHDLWVRILRDRSFIYPFIDEISVGLTSMFRDPVLWKSLRFMLGNGYFKGDRINIWHAGCSTGEEVYTMAIVIGESGCKARASVLATDISNQALETAMKGEYVEMKLAEYNQNYFQYNPVNSLKKYYAENGKFASFDLSLISNVDFRNHNLITGPFEKNKYHIIFCRNVMIYFDNAAKRKLFDKFYEALVPDGLLVIGFYDAVLPLVDQSKFLVLDMDAKIFRRK